LAKISFTGTIRAASKETMRRISVIHPKNFRQKGTHAKAIFALGMVCFFWGTTWIASKQGVKYMPALQLAGIRQLLGGSCYLLYFLYKGATWPKGKEWGPIILLAILNFSLSNGLSTWGVKYITAGLGSIIGAIVPLWIVLIGYLRTRELKPITTFGIVLGFGGICVVFFEHLHDFFNPQFSFGIFMSITATLTWAIGSLYTKKQALSFNPYMSIGLQMVISGIALSAVSGVTGATVPIWEIPWQSWVAISYLVIFGSVISFIAYLYALQHLSAEQSSIYAYINPIIAVLFGAALFQEPLTIYIIAGGMITLLGVYLVQRGQKAINN
jgi:drug/metabolite transporter (DMT)-like permease